MRGPRRGARKTRSEILRVAIHQPQYLPYPGFFHKLSLADTLVVMDDVQYDRRFTNRNRILAPQGPVWLTVPIDKAGKFSRNMDVRINNSLPWREEHWKRITYSYRNAVWYQSYAGFLERIYGTRYDFLLDLDMDLTAKIVEWLGLDIRIVKESELGALGTGTERLVNVCLAIGADTYVSGAGGKNYMDESLFSSNGIRLVYQRYTPKPYPQRFVSRFVSDLSVLDMLFSLGPECGHAVMESGEAPPSLPPSPTFAIEDFLASD